MAALRVGYLSDVDPRNRWAWSGGHFYMFQGLRDQGLSVTHVGRSLAKAPSRFRRVARRLSFREERRTRTEDNLVTTARREAKMVQRELVDQEYDVLFAPVASRLVAFLETQTPIAYLSDATFRILRGYYPEISALPPSHAAQREEIEARALARSSLLVFPSAWAAESAVCDYGVARDRVRIVPLGANLDTTPPRAQATRKSHDSACRLLFIGRDWVRKGGTVAIETLRALQARGIAADLTICGSTPPAGTDLSGIEVHANLDKRQARDRETLQDLLLRSHFLVLPTRAECFGIVCCEANAYGLPVLGTDTGGLPIEQGQNGFRLSPESNGKDYAKIIEDVWCHATKYERLVQSARTVYEDRLNWKSWSSTMTRELEHLAQHRSTHAARVA